MKSMDVNRLRALLRMLEHRVINITELAASELDEDYLSYLHGQKIVRLDQEELHVIDPVSLAMEAVKLGADIEVVSQWLSWRDFEKLCVEALRSHDFEVKAPFRFKVDGSRHEVDVVARKKNVVLCIDCKHWNMKHGQQYKIKVSAANHLSKCIKFAEVASSLRDLGLNINRGACLIPVIVTLMDLNLRYPVNGVWVLPIFKLNSFLLDLEVHVDELSSIEIC